MTMVTTQLNFSHRFPGAVWNTVADPDRKVMVIEVRDSSVKQVSFFAIDYERNVFLWSDQKLEESWWVNATAVYDGVILFTVYLDTNNPDKKGVVAYSLENFRLLWWHNDFSISEVGTIITGFTSKLGLKEQYLDLKTGTVLQGNLTGEIKLSKVEKPVLYTEGMEYFETVKRFLVDRLNFSPLTALEYLETESHILISVYIEENGLANYLIVMNRGGAVQLKEILDHPVQGIGLDTFFVVDNFLFFLKNKVELVSYTLI